MFPLAFHSTKESRPTLAPPSGEKKVGLLRSAFYVEAKAPTQKTSQAFPSCWQLGAGKADDVRSARFAAFDVGDDGARCRIEHTGQSQRESGNRQQGLL